MTHEIMNSIAPISSLAETMKSRLHEANNKRLSEENPLEDLEIGIDTIKKRSEGLLKFAETYRNLNKITTLNLQKVFVSDLFANIHHLMQPTFQQKGIELEILLKDPDLFLNADLNLLEQVLINLVVNAIEAVKEKASPRIVLSAEQGLNKKIIIRVADNGQGMPEELLDKIFIPFFSTKKHGSGIGLSLCKQIIMLHKGTIKVQSADGQGTVFLMQFG
jgi:signal transduction histidine kinase